MDEKAIGRMLAWILVMLIIALGVLVGCQREVNLCYDGRCAEGEVCVVRASEIGGLKAVCWEVE